MSVDEKEPTPSVEAGSKRHIIQRCIMLYQFCVAGDISIGLLAQILAEADISREEWESI